MCVGILLMNKDSFPAKTWEFVLLFILLNSIVPAALLNQGKVFHTLWHRAKLSIQDTQVIH